MHRLLTVAMSIVIGASAGCGKTTCGTDDFECIMDNSTFLMNGTSVRPVKLPTSRVPAPAPTMAAGTPPSNSAMQISIIPMSAPNFGDPIQMIQAGMTSLPGGGGSGVPAAAITMPPANVMLTASRPVQTLSIGYTDPYGMTPSFVFLPHIATPVCWAFPPIRDLQLEGVALITIDAGNVQMTPVSPASPAATVIEPTPINPTPIGPTDIRPSVITATPIVSWFQPPLDPGSGSGKGNGTGNGSYTECNDTPIANCNSKSPAQCGSIQECCSSNGQCIICAPDCTNPLNTWGPCDASACYNEAQSAVGFCCPSGS
jgi:hypothetical protein